MIKKAKPTKSTAKKKVPVKAAKKAPKAVAKKTVAKTTSANRLNNLIKLPKRSAAKSSGKPHFIMRVNGKLVFE